MGAMCCDLWWVYVSFAVAVAVAVPYEYAAACFALTVGGVTGVDGWDTLRGL